MGIQETIVESGQQDKLRLQLSGLGQCDLTLILEEDILIARV